MGPVCLQHSCDAARCDQLAGASVVHSFTPAAAVADVLLLRRSNWTRSYNSARLVKPASAPSARSCTRSVSVRSVACRQFAFWCTASSDADLVAPREPADELIRQVTINCAERGLLLLRVRDEIRMTIAAYQTLYESSIAFGMRKALMAEQKKADMEATVGCGCVTWRARVRVYCASF